ncbi:MAG: class I SAM-dependent methyltransferase [Victivallales bacterium]|jgi:SAM-dependent methyltransferase
MSLENKYDAEKEWNRLFLNAGMSFPSEYVIRILKGAYPRLNLDKDAYRDSKFCDIGCGDGRNLLLAKTCGFDIHGVEITREIVDRVKSNLRKAGVEKMDVRVGKNDSIPFGDAFFNYLLSWNACYYMGDKTDFGSYVKEFARVLDKDGYLILSIPKKSCFIFKNSEEHGEGYRIIRDDPFKVRNGEVLRIFRDEQEIEEVFSPYFKDFIFASIHDDCFGYEYHWHLAVCKRK